MDLDLDNYDDLELSDIASPTAEVPFTTALDNMFKKGDVNISSLFRLSDMQAREHDQFMARWAEAHDGRRFVIARHLADISEDNFEVEFSPLLKAFLNDKSDAVRLAALDGLWDTTNSTAIPPIIRLLREDSVDNVRKAAASTLAHVVLLGEWGQISERMRDMAVDALIVEHVNIDNSLGLRRASLESLGASSHERVPALITDAYESGNHELQLSAIFAMGNSADVAWMGTIIAEMDSPLSDIRAEAARAAGELGSSDAISHLAELAFDIDEEVQIAAIVSIGKIGSDRANDLLKQFAQDDELEHLKEAIALALVEGDDTPAGAPFDPFEDDWDDDDEDNWDEMDEDADYLEY